MSASARISGGGKHSCTACPSPRRAAGSGVPNRSTSRAASFDAAPTEICLSEDRPDGEFVSIPSSGDAKPRPTGDQCCEARIG